ncbi:MAG: hypothetical protein HYT72_02405 [Candidatus Aenigmarchaeota archaeon]|nr:hypothetical protein [Candidatus Aenigmarchaeota archaeon]
MSKGQIIMSDLLLAITVLSILVIYLGGAIDNTFDKFASNKQLHDMELGAVKISDMLVRSAGYPANWEDNPVSAISIGLSSSDRVLDGKKLSAFTNLDYQTAKKLLGTSEYEFYFRLVRNGTEKGLLPGGEKTVTVRRIASYNGADTVEFTLWK